MSRSLQVGVFTFIFLTLTTLNGTAQPAVNLTGPYRCVQGCAPGFEGRTAIATQNGWDLNLVTEAGVPLRAWFDWFSPRTRIWIETLHQGAVYSPDGLTIQFDRGTVWVRAQEIVPYATNIANCARRFRSYDPVSQTYLGRDGQRHPCP
jgi:hypothetical protein